MLTIFDPIATAVTIWARGVIATANTWVRCQWVKVAYTLSAHKQRGQRRHARMMKGKHVGRRGRK